MNHLTFTALADPHRFQIVELLRDRPHTVGEIAEQLGLRQPQTSKHLRVLADAGLVHMEPQANRRIAHLQPTAFRDLDDWLTRYRPLWEARLDRLDDYLRTLPPEPPTHDPTEPGGSP
ncbi:MULTISPECIES: ArsR/SmtB family transcription factor [unclassified Deinococcus]|uniref:ArsR/SmtB family transcription factor n=1 Tax=unclassified Deinococcus TaxID=2623546 RepID=UPI001C30A193|nr:MULTISPECIES: metalloregulator ArsR/SmtB family transcription factor [unclassified Deinococcus]MDK2013103.1 metalloregulator ArsR/SmtB family transcription factor [Deinococcus sp. 43]